MKYLLDTCVVSDFVKGETNTLKKIKRTSPADIAISSITVMEIEYGLALNAKRASFIKPIISDFLNAITILDFNEKDAKQSAIMRAHLKQQGCPIGSYDILLAGVALNRKLIFVSANTKEFSRIKALKLEDWRTSNTL